METWIMLAVAAAVLVLPYALGVAFNGRDRTDSAGRRIDRRWHV